MTIRTRPVIWAVLVSISARLSNLKKTIPALYVNLSVITSPGLYHRNFSTMFPWISGAKETSWTIPLQASPVAVRSPAWVLAITQ